MAVAHVVLNRVNHPTRWPKTIEGVIKQPWQFSYRWDGSMMRGIREKDQYERVTILAKQVIDGKIASPVGTSMFYHNTSVTPYWAKKKRFVKKIDSHKFYEFI